MNLHDPDTWLLIYCAAAAMFMASRIRMMLQDPQKFTDALSHAGMAKWQIITVLVVGLICVSVVWPVGLVFKVIDRTR